MAELELVPNPDECCSTEAQESCCEPTDKAACCGESAAGGSCGCSAGASTDDTEEIREAVRARYAAAASVAGGGSCCDSGAAVLTDEEAAVFGAGLYGETSDELPDTATMASLGCGNPTAVAELREGETVLDLGSGGGIDVLLSGRRVGPTGKALRPRHDRRDAGPRPREPGEGRGRERRVAARRDRGDPAAG